MTAASRELRAALAAYASLVFARAPWVGALVAAASLTRPAVGACGVLAVITAHVAARVLGYRADAIATGTYGYSAILVGLALGYGHAVDARLLVLVAFAGALTAFTTAVLADLFHRGAGLPVLALPFVLLTTLLAPALLHLPHAPADRVAYSYSFALPAVVDAALRALGGIVFAPLPLAGALIIVALVIASRISAAIAIVGLAIAALTGVLLEASPEVALAMAYNAALSAIAIGAACFVPGRAALAAAALTAGLTAWLAAGMVALLAPLGVPVIAWPFTLMALIAIRALHLRAPDRAPFATPLPGESPERNLEYASSRRRFGLPGPPQLALPFFGTWAITQGVDGAHTHHGPWLNALDFEALDDAGFPFRGDGLRLEDYRSFGLPVLAPAAGLVVAVHDGIPDSLPGEVDTAQPWGNAIVIAIGGDLHVVLAHLKLGSPRVAVGDSVIAGQPIAACGASGRSPRPHLHLQVQRGIALGGDALPFRLVHYIVEAAAGDAGATRRYVAVGVPAEHARVTRPAPSPLVEVFTALPVGGELHFALDDADGGDAGAQLRVRSEVGLHGERYLRDLDRGDRLYFTVVAGSLAFTAHVGPASAPLRAVFQALPRLPSVAGAVELVDHPPASALLAWPARALHDVARVIGDPVECRADIALREGADGGVTITTSVGVGLRGHVRPRYRGVIELDHAGLRALELIDERRHGAVRLRARRVA